MSQSSAEFRRRQEMLSRSALEDYQLGRLNALLAAILPHNSFYADKLAKCPHQLTSIDQLNDFPFTSKEDLIPEGASHNLPANLTWPVQRYLRYHQTSGTHGRPLAVYDTAADWQWWTDCWQYVLDAADITAEDSALLAFSFGKYCSRNFNFNKAFKRYTKKMDMDFCSNYSNFRFTLFYALSNDPTLKE